jgi:AcrR family transcriptional regulator
MTDTNTPPRPGPAPPQDGRSRGDTRARIQDVAVALFTEQGYEKTSLREIAEHLEVTKAALYYHFKSKEDIVRSLVEDYVGQVDELIAWAKDEPSGAATSHEVLRRYVAIVAGGERVFRMLHENQATIKSLANGKPTGEVFRERLGSLIGLLTGPGAPVEDRLRATMALGGISLGWMFFADEVPDRDELSAAILRVASGITVD